MTGVVDTSRSIDISRTQDIGGKKVLVVGGTSGLGRAIAVEAAHRGANVQVVGRSFKDEGVANLSFEKADLSSMKEAKRIGETTNADLDVIVLTTGIIAGSTRVESEEGLEMDMAVSYLSRLVILKYLVPRLNKSQNTRIFVMGFPGSAPDNIRVDDLNSEKEYGGGFGWVHMNTVAGNESLVLDWAAKDKTNSYFGLNPGLIKTGIRQNTYDTAVMNFFGSIIEGMLQLFAQTPEGYGKIMADLIFAEKLEEHSGISFNPKGQPTLKSEIFAKDDDLAKTFVTKSESLLKEKAGV